MIFSALILSKLKNIFQAAIKWKGTYIIIAVLFVVITFLSLSRKIKNYESKIKNIRSDYEQQIGALSVSNEVLIKDNLYIKKELDILQSYSNSQKIIERMHNAKLDEETIIFVHQVAKEYKNNFVINSN